MTQTEFLETKVYIDLENLNNGFDKEDIRYFSEADFEIVLQRAEHFGIAIFKIEPRHDGEVYKAVTHEAFRKKATDPKWYKKAFMSYRKEQAGLAYSASYKVSAKLLAREEG